MEPLKASVAASGEFITMTGPAWTFRWAAPELLDGVFPSLESNIWAFGWICWEVITGKFPFHEENDVTVIRRIIQRISQTSAITHSSTRLRGFAVLWRIV